MSAHLLVMYPHPTDVPEFDRAYREEHLPCAGPDLVGATCVITKRVFGPGEQPYRLMSVVSFPTEAELLACVLSRSGQRALAHAASISTGGTPTVIAVVDA
jgi:uncharacterized protein (TIGR02118 family)